MEEARFPITCQLDRAKLNSIETKLDKVLEKQEYFISVDGPLGRVKEDISVISSSVKAAHVRIDDHDDDINRLGERQWTMWAKPALVGGGGAGMIWGVIEAFKLVINRL